MDVDETVPVENELGRAEVQVHKTCVTSTQRTSFLFNSYKTNVKTLLTEKLLRFQKHTCLS